MNNKKRLIDANVLIRDINADPYRTESEKSYDRCLVRRQPTVDAVEAEPGYWEPDPWHPGFVRCSVCHDCIIPADRADDETIRYCHYCGTRLKEL